MSGRAPTTMPTPAPTLAPTPAPTLSPAQMFINAYCGQVPPASSSGGKKSMATPPPDDMSPPFNPNIPMPPGMSMGTGSSGGKKGSSSSDDGIFCWDVLYSFDDPGGPIFWTLDDVCDGGKEIGESGLLAGGGNGIFTFQGTIGFPIFGPEYSYSIASQYGPQEIAYQAELLADCGSRDGMIPNTYDIPRWVTGGSYPGQVEGLLLLLERNIGGESLGYGYFCHGGYDDSGIYEPIADYLDIYYNGCPTMV